MSERETFDVNQGHGDHIDCLNGYANSAQFLSEWLPRAIKEGSLVMATKAPVPCSLGDEIPAVTHFFMVGDKDGPVRFAALIAAVDEKQSNDVISAYPECDGNEVEVKIVEIHEWANGVEATIDGTVLGDCERRIAFFDTRYAFRKGSYEIGKTYRFRLAAFAYSVDVVPEKEREFRLEGEAAAERRKVFGEEPKFEPDGSISPLVFRMDKMVAYFSESEAYPDDAEFQSPVFKRVESCKRFGTDFYRLEIAIAREERDITVPLIAKKSLLGTRPKKGDPVRGHLWLQGYCIGNIG